MSGPTNTQGAELADAIQSGVYLSYLLTSDDDLIFETLLTHPDINDWEELPAGRARSLLQAISRGHFFAPCTISHHTVARTLAMSPRSPPSAVELFLATATLYHGFHHAFISAAPTHHLRTESYDLSPMDILPILLATNERCVGHLDTYVIPVVQFIASIAIHRGVFITAPRSSWPSSTTGPFRPPIWASALSFRRRIPRDALLAEFRPSPSCMESFPRWVLGRPLVIDGPFASVSGTVRDCFLRSQTTYLASLRSTPHWAHRCICLSSAAYTFYGFDCPDRATARTDHTIDTIDDRWLRHPPSPSSCERD